MEKEIKNKILVYSACGSSVVSLALLMASVPSGASPQWIKVSASLSGMVTFLLWCLFFYVYNWRPIPNPDKYRWIEKVMNALKYFGWADGILLVGAVLYYVYKGTVPYHGTIFLMATFLVLVAISSLYRIMEDAQDRLWKEMILKNKEVRRVCL